MNRILDRLAAGGVDMTWRRLARQGVGVFTLAAVLVTGIGFGVLMGLVGAGAEVNEQGAGAVLMANVAFCYVGWLVWTWLGAEDAPNAWRWRRDVTPIEGEGSERFVQSMRQEDGSISSRDVERLLIPFGPWRDR